MMILGSTANFHCYLIETSEYNDEMLAIYVHDPSLRDVPFSRHAISHHQGYEIVVFIVNDNRNKSEFGHFDDMDSDELRSYIQSAIQRQCEYFDVEVNGKNVLIIYPISRFFP
ncbi:hypothetical protein NF212_25180 [Parasalinivibrio latis]|uniref:hypothetical protein n=1 Tax=Parasalinivibrio latis TaxID=2952610 RepID=UPI0030E3A7E0